MITSTALILIIVRIIIISSIAIRCKVWDSKALGTEFPSLNYPFQRDPPHGWGLGPRRV